MVTSPPRLPSTELKLLAIHMKCAGCIDVKGYDFRPVLRPEGEALEVMVAEDVGEAVLVAM